MRRFRRAGAEATAGALGNGGGGRATGRGGEGRAPAELERKPQPERSEMAGELGRQVGGRRSDLALAQWPDIIGAGAERVGKVAAVAGQHRSGPVGQEQG